MRSPIIWTTLLVGLAVLAIWGIWGVANVTTAGNERLRLSEQKLLSLTKKADLGDAGAAKIISDHFLFALNDWKAGFEWKERAALLGDEKSRSWLADYINRRGMDDYRSHLQRTNSEMEMWITAAPSHRSTPAQGVSSP